VAGAQPKSPKAWKTRRDRAKSEGEKPNQTKQDTLGNIYKNRCWCVCFCGGEKGRVWVERRGSSEVVSLFSSFFCGISQILLLGDRVRVQEQATQRREDQRDQPRKPKKKKRKN